MQLIEVETSFGTIAAGEQALVDAIRDILMAEAANRRATPEDLIEALNW